MPSPHHHNHHQCSCCCSCSDCCSSFSNPSLPPLFTSDQLLQALATQLLLQSQSQSPSPSPSPPHIHSHHYHKSQQTPPPAHQQSKDHHHDHQTHPLLLHSLLRCIATLESSLPNPLFPISLPLLLTFLLILLLLIHNPRQCLGLRLHPLVLLFEMWRRGPSRPASSSSSCAGPRRPVPIKSHAAALRSSLSDQTARRDPKVLSGKAMDLLLQLFDGFPSLLGKIFPSIESVDFQPSRLKVGNEIIPHGSLTLLDGPKSHNEVWDEDYCSKRHLPGFSEDGIIWRPKFGH